MSRRLTTLSLRFVVTFTLWISFCALVAESRAQSEDDSRKADARARRALEYEVEGQSDFRNIMLRAALEVDPQHVSANWHSGRVRQNDHWLTIAEARQLARKSEILSKYRELREAAYGDQNRQVHLARWCARFGLAERSKLHYALLLLDPSVDESIHQEALRKLDLHEVGGRLVSDEQLKHYQKTAAKTKKAMDRWQPQLLKWRKVIEGRNDAKAEFAVEQMLAVDDSSIVPVLESFLPVNSNRFGVALVQLLGSFPEHEATKALASFAVLSPSEEVRNEAIGALKSRPIHEYVPMFLSRLTSPVKSKWRLYRDRLGNIRYEHLALREGASENQLLAIERVTAGADPVVDWGFARKPNDGAPLFFSREEEFDAIREGKVNKLEQINRVYPAGVRRKETNQEAVMAAGLLVRAIDTEKQLSNYNTMVSASNAAVFHALEQTTAVVVARDPINWWSWWEEYNETHKPPKRTQLAMDRRLLLFTRSVGTQLYDYRPGLAGTMSCFVAGTLVWAESGLTPIEDIQIGDRVLSQDPGSGELAFKLVIGKTLRPPAALTRIRISGEEILTTKGHPMWVVSKGWRMAKFIEEGQELHGIDGGTMVQEVELLKRQEEAHNLVVADFATYFVGETGVLVHDNTYRKPTRALIPGFVEN